MEMTIIMRLLLLLLAAVVVTKIIMEKAASKGDKGRACRNNLCRVEPDRRQKNAHPRVANAARLPC